jgi:putative NADH-flavin reductase
MSGPLRRPARSAGEDSSVRTPTLTGFLHGGKAMKLLVLGATGGTGLEIVRQSLDRGHLITAFVRSANRLNALHDRIAIQEGDLLNSAELAGAVKGQDAIISAFGPRLPIAKGDANLLQRFALALTNAMRRTGVRRVVVESVAFLFKNSIMPPAYLLGRLFFPGVVADTSLMERIFAESRLDWTMVRPPQLTEAVHGKVSDCRWRSTCFRFHNFSRGCGRLHDQGC